MLVLYSKKVQRNVVCLQSVSYTHLDVYKRQVYSDTYYEVNGPYTVKHCQYLSQQHYIKVTVQAPRGTRAILHFSSSVSTNIVNISN